MDIGTASGLALSSGINAYLPLLSFAIASRWFHLYKVNPDFSYITQDWFIIGLAVLTFADILTDKIPVADHIWDAIHTVVRPIAGALVAAASMGQVSGFGLAVPLVAGGVLAGMVHTTKAGVRLTSTVTTAGITNPILSIVEDIVVVIGIFISLVFPIVMIVLAVIFIVIFFFSFRRIRRAFQKKRAVSSP